MMLILLSLYTVAEDFADIFHSLDIWHKAKKYQEMYSKGIFGIINFTAVGFVSLYRTPMHVMNVSVLGGWEGDLDLYVSYHC